MTTKLFKIDIELSPNQKKNLSRAYHKRETITLRLSANALSGNDTLHVTQTVAKRFDKNRELKKGMDIKLSKSNIRNRRKSFNKQSEYGKTSITNCCKTLGLSALGGLASEGASQLVKAISGRGKHVKTKVPVKNERYCIPPERL